MPSSKPKPSEIAAEAKKTYIPYIRQTLHATWPATSFLCYSDALVARPPAPENMKHVRFAFYDRDPVDVALDWNPEKIPVIMPANDKRPGGDWEAGVMSPEECLCRRSNLYATMTTSDERNSAPSNYPIPTRAGIFSGKVVVFRNGPDKYEVWPEMKCLPIISVCPVKRPKLDNAGKKYSFKQEKELMREKIRTALRIAIWAHQQQTDCPDPGLVIGSFGLGPGFRNPTEEVAIMWRDAFMKDPEFVGQFGDVVFAFENLESSTNSSSSKGSSSKSSSSSKGSSSKSNPSSSSSSSSSDLDIFRKVFKPSEIHGAFKGQ